jgi:hypothetical protein
MIVGGVNIDPRTSQTCIELHRTAFGCTPPPALEANAQVSAKALQGCGPGCRGFESPHSPQDRQATEL